MARHSEEWKAWEKELEEANAAHKKAEQEEIERKRAESEAKKAEAEAKKAEGVAVLAQWVVLLGSELVRARRAGGYEWVGMAESEYAAHVVKDVTLARAAPPEGYDETPESVEDRHHPTLSEIRAVESVRESVGNRGDVELNWVQYDPSEDDEDEYDHDDRESLSRAEIWVSVPTPTGRVVVFEFLPAVEETAAK